MIEVEETAIDTLRMLECVAFEAPKNKDSGFVAGMEKSRVGVGGSELVLVLSVVFDEVDCDNAWAR
jgi:hypothetical protein